MTLSHLRTITERKRRVSRQYWNYESYYQHQYQMHLGRMIFVRITVYTCIKKKIRTSVDMDCVLSSVLAKNLDGFVQRIF